MGSKRAHPQILVVNDDGIHGEGLEALIEALKAVGKVTAVVPEKECSAESHSLTLHKPLRLRKVREGVYKLNGSPADCTRLGVLKLLNNRVDLVASGINKGYNLGQDVVYSGTVAAAMEGTMLNIPAFAVSRAHRGGRDFRAAGEFSRALARQILRRGLPPGVLLNVNIPNNPHGDSRRPQVARLGERVYDSTITRRSDPVGNTYYWLMGKAVRSLPKPGTDVAAIKNGRISLTPLAVDNTHAPTLNRLKKWTL